MRATTFSEEIICHTRDFWLFATTILGYLPHLEWQGFRKYFRWKINKSICKQAQLSND